MVDLISNNKQIFQQTRRAVREDIVDTSDYKIDKTGRKYKAHRIKLGDTPAADGSVELAKEEVVQLTEAQDPPFVLVLKRKAIRLYPDGTKIALYHNDRLDKDFAVPYSTSSQPVIQAEAVDAIGQLQKIKDYHQQNLEDAIKSMEAGISPVIIDNTNVQKWEFEKYLDAAEVNGYDVKFETLDPTNYSEDFIRELAERQKKTHNVPEQVIIDMLKRWED